MRYISVVICKDMWTAVGAGASGLAVSNSVGLGSRVLSVLDLGAEGPGFKPQPRRCRVTVLGKLFTPMCLFAKQQNW